MPVPRALHAAAAVLVAVAGLAGCSSGSSTSRSDLIWHDEFNGSAGSAPDRSLWKEATGGGGWGNEELETYTSSRRNSALDGDGHLVITARRSGSGTSATWTSARLTTAGKKSTRYGRLAVRARMPAGAGLWPAAWTSGSDLAEVGWPDCGEIDLVESVNAMTSASQTVHGPITGSSKDWQASASTTPKTGLSAGYHVFSADWTSHKIVFALDGVTTKTITPASMPTGATWPFTQAQDVLLDLAVGGTFPGAPDSTTPATNRMLVDWVRFYRPGH